MKQKRREITPQDVANIWYWYKKLGKSAKQVAKRAGRTTGSIRQIIQHTNPDLGEYQGRMSKTVVHFAHITPEEWTVSPKVKTTTSTSVTKNESSDLIKFFIKTDLFDAETKIKIMGAIIDG